MIAKKINPTEFINPVEERYRYRYNEIDRGSKKYLAKKSCKHCYGTGKCGWISENVDKGQPKQTVYCSCLRELKKEFNKDAKEA